MPVAGPEHQIEAGKNGIKIDFRPEPGRPGSEADGPEDEQEEERKQVGKRRQRVHDSRKSALFFLFLRVSRKNSRIRSFSYSCILSGSVPY